MYNNYYDYQELKEKATGPNAKQSDINALGEWFDRYGAEYWNGESYTVDSSNNLYPLQEAILDENGEIDYCNIVGYTFSKSEAIEFFEKNKRSEQQ